MLAKHLDLPINNISVDLFGGAHLKPEYEAINPFKKVPVIIDHDNNDFVLWESRAILAYLVDKYAPDHELYPKDPTKRANIDKWLYFDNGSLFPALLSFLKPVIFEGKPFDQDLEKAVLKCLTEMNAVMKKDGYNYLAGNHLTLADLSLIASVSHVCSIRNMDMKDFPEIKKWWEMLKEELSYYKQINEEPLAFVKKIVEEKQAAYLAGEQK
jgi:glutathione S-transferase